LASGAVAGDLLQQFPGLSGRGSHPSYHVQFESLLSLTGSKADRRICVAPHELAATMQQLGVRLAKKGAAWPHGQPVELPASVSTGFLDHLADFLWENRRRSLIVCGSQDVQ